MSLDAQPIKLTKRGRIVIEPDGSVYVSDFDGDKMTCREVCVLALGWAIEHLTAEMMKMIEQPGGSDLVCEATNPFPHPMKDGCTSSVLASSGGAHRLTIHYATREQADAAQEWLANGPGHVAEVE